MRVTPRVPVTLVASEPDLGWAEAAMGECPRAQFLIAVRKEACDGRRKPERVDAEELKGNPASTLSDANRTEPATAGTSTLSGHDGQRRQKEQRAEEPVQAAARPGMISERKLQANRANAKKSTGPRTARGKAFSRGNATKHGLRSQATLFRLDGKPIDPDLRAVLETLREEFGRDQGRIDPLVRAVVVECSHQRRATELEESYFQNSLDDPSSKVSLRNLQRYLTTSRRALLKNLGLLRKLAPSIPQTEAESGDQEASCQSHRITPGLL